MAPANTSRAFDDPVASFIEQRIPRLVDQVCARWGTRDFEPFIWEMIMDTNDGARQGFPWEVAQELFFLAELSVAKRALEASRLTEQPYREVFQRMMLNMENQATINNALAWINPALSSESRQMAKGAPIGRRSGLDTLDRQTARQKRGFFSWLFGRR